MNAPILAAMLLIFLVGISIAAVNILVGGAIWRLIEPESRPRRWVLISLLVSLGVIFVWLPVSYPQSPSKTCWALSLCVLVATPLSVRSAERPRSVFYRGPASLLTKTNFVLFGFGLALMLALAGADDSLSPRNASPQGIDRVVFHVAEWFSGYVAGAVVLALGVAIASLRRIPRGVKFAHSILSLMMLFVIGLNLFAGLLLRWSGPFFNF